MRILSYALFALALVVAGLGLLANLYAQGMGCAYSTSGHPCLWRMPWEMGHEDFQFLFALPAGLASLLALGGWPGGASGPFAPAGSACRV